ncbi:MAG: prephenate dehydratase [Melioribacteraceae bacterium]|nr:prephenate dehydratase [Melioribacteraceae bacterium]MCF8356846.1 prephenate dehydratase [Melioribacteraceae bacterium]MCF8396225.1 prephenate dehydratase [Melioribacteraceae bacterium]MCF8421148.1 prephenate dehydratase [Melioribacteraceae bacterium]
MDQLAILRNKINKLDESIIELLSERRKLSEEIVRVKGISDKPIRDKEREKQLLAKLREIADEKGIDPGYISRVFHEIIEDSVRLQNSFLQRQLGSQLLDENKISVSLQGIEGSYSYLAARKFFSQMKLEIEFISKKRFEDVVKSVENGESDYAILPIENTTSGGINEVYDLLLHTTLSIIGEETFQVKHCLVSTEEIELKKIKKIYSHYQAAAQCSKFLDSLSHVPIEYFADTALSVQKIKEEGKAENAAIASQEAANLFNVKVLRREIANQNENFTRFIIASRKSIEVSKRIQSKVSLVMSTAHKAGSLADALTIFSTHKINLTKLESRPVLGNPWEEMFYIDFEGNLADQNVKNMLDELRKQTRFIKILGCYPNQNLRSEDKKS